MSRYVRRVEFMGVRDLAQVPVAASDRHPDHVDAQVDSGRGDGGVDVAMPVGRGQRCGHRVHVARPGHISRPLVPPPAEHAPTVGAAGGDDLGRHAGHRRVRRRTRDGEPLRVVDVVVGERGQVGEVLDALADHRGAEAVRERDERFEHRGLDRVLADAGDDLPVDLHVVGSHLRQPEQAGVAGAHVVDRDRGAAVAQPIEVRCRDRPGR